MSIVNKWNEIDLEMFLEIFDSFRNHEDWTERLILEIQYVPFLMIDKETCFHRLYVGYMGEKFFMEHNKSLMDDITKASSSFLKSKGAKVDENFSSFVVETMKNFINKDTISLVTLSSEPTTKSRHIDFIPLFRGSLNLFYKYLGLKGKDYENRAVPVSIETPNRLSVMSYSYLKDTTDNKIIINFTNKEIKETDNIKRYIRVRTIDRDSWETMVDDYLNNNCNLKWTNNDITENDIKLYFFPLEEDK